MQGYACMRPTDLLVLDEVRLVHDDHSEGELRAAVSELPQEVVGGNDGLRNEPQSVFQESRAALMLSPVTPCWHIPHISPDSI